MVKLALAAVSGRGACFVCCSCAFQCVDRRWVWQRIDPLPPLAQTPQAGISGLKQGLRSCPCCTAILPAAEKTCPRCGVSAAPRRQHSLQWTLALLITSVMLYIPSNIMPIMVTETLGSQYPSNIMAGVILLWSDGSAGRAGDFYRQYYGAFAEDGGDWLAVLARQAAAGATARRCT